MNRASIQAINLKAELEAVTDYWSPRVVGRVNDQYVKVAKLKGTLTWHAHDDEDELFQIIKGNLRIEFEDCKEVLLTPGDFCVVPKGVRHNPVAEEECWIVLIETVTTKHTGNVQTLQTKSIDAQLNCG